MRESDAPVETPTKAHHQRWRTADVVAMGLAAALVVGSAGTGIVVAARAVETATASTTSTTQTPASRVPTNRDSYGGQAVGGPSGGYGVYGGSGGSAGGRTGTSGSNTSGTNTATLDTAAASSAQSGGVVVIDTQLAYENAAAAGTGLILSPDGRILTNNHVVQGATSITVTVVSTGAEYTAQVVGTDATDDVAVLELVGASGLTVADLDTSGTVAVGDAVTGVGNANGTGSLTAAAGTVLNLEQSITAQDATGSSAEKLSGLIEVAADIQSGESGGPLYDADGEVVGMDTAASTGTATPTGYAIPIEDALAVVTAIDAAAATGQDTATISVGYPALLGIELSGSTGTGAAVVGGVIAGTPAQTIGLAAGDTITAVDGTAVPTSTALSAALAGYQPGDTVTLTWVDAAGTPHSAPATLIAGPVS